LYHNATFRQSITIEWNSGEPFSKECEIQGLQRNMLYSHFPVQQKN